ncbi:MAG: ABC transporter substrate-binding protein [Bacteroidetes bacterium]|nr:ABC transporter substrate-binding protein [Bacteroidota bacterium]MCL5026362.1 ABC transporter substrate-binding protein [Chloroflexota bacterium]
MQAFAKLGIVVLVLFLIAACSPAAPTVAPPKPAAAPTAPPPASSPAAAVTAPPASTAAAPAPTPAGKVKRGGTVVYARTGETNSWDPLLHQSGDNPLELPLYETLIRYDEVDEKTGKSEYRGELAESWETPDPNTVVLKLRKGVKFHDGSDFNAEVVKWDIERAKTHPKSVVKVWAAFIKSVDAVDANTVRLNLAYPTALVYPNLTRASGGSGSGWSMMISKAAAEKSGDAYERNPVGTGPVMMTQMLRDDKTTFKKWEGYWRKGVDGQPLPYYDGITARVILDPAVILVEMKAGTVHVTQNIEPYMFPQVKASPDFRLRVMPWAPIRFVFGFNPKAGPFADNLKLRQAAQYAVDRKAIADALGFGEFLPNYHVYWGPSFPGWDESLPHYDYQPDKAKQLMKEAGYPDGINFGFIAYPPPMYKQPAEMVQAQWAKVGLRAKLDAIETVAARSKQKAGDFDAAFWGGWPSLDPAHFSRMYKCDGSANWSNYCSKEMDACMDEGESLYDPAKRAEVYKRCQKIFYDDALVGGTHLRPFTLGNRSELKGVRVQAYLMDLQEAWLDK